MRTSYRDIFLLACCQALLLALPFIAVVALATAWLAMLPQRLATPTARPPQTGW
jgi:hypothetical protein